MSMPSRPEAASTPQTAASLRPDTAVVPAAGLGTRLRPLTDFIAKEMLPVGRRLVLEIILEEMAGAGMERIVFVLSPTKQPIIKARFGEKSAGLALEYVLQTEMRGLGHAVLQAAPFFGESANPFVVALGDAIFEETESGAITRRLCAACAENDAKIGLAVQTVPRERISRYGIVRPARALQGNEAAFGISEIVEKPQPDDAPSDFAAAARYVVRPDIFAILEKTIPSTNNEIQFTDALQAVLQKGELGIAVPLQTGETRHDIGGLDSYFKAFAAFALTDAQHGAGLQEYLINRLHDAAQPNQKETKN